MVHGRSSHAVLRNNRDFWYYIQYLLTLESVRYHCREPEFYPCPFNLQTTVQNFFYYSDNQPLCLRQLLHPLPDTHVLHTSAQRALSPPGFPSSPSNLPSSRQYGPDSFFSYCDGSCRGTSYFCSQVSIASTKLFSQIIFLLKKSHSL